MKKQAAEGKLEIIMDDQLSDDLEQEPKEFLDSPKILPNMQR